MVFDIGWLKENPLWSLSDAVSTVWEEYPRAWVEYWGIGASHAPDHLEPDEWEAANRLNAQAERLSNAAIALTRRRLPDRMRSLPAVLQQEEQSEKEAMEEVIQQLRESLTPEQLESEKWRRVERQLMWLHGEAETRRGVFQTAMELHASQHFRLDPRTVAKRTIKLLDFLVLAEGEATLEYLQRVAECYIKEMGPELIVMARAVLEAALGDCNLEARVRRNLGIREGQRESAASLKALIQAASDEDLLDPETRQLADWIRDNGNRTVHSVPQDAADPDEVMRKLVQILNRLHERGSARR